MNPPRDPSTRGALALGAAVALAALVCSALLDLPYLAAGVAPGVWVVLEARRARAGCPHRRTAPPDHAALGHPARAAADRTA